MQACDGLVVIGAFGIDTNVYAVGDRRGAEMSFARVTDGLGQAGCYSALASSALGVPTHAVAALGADHLGAWVHDELAAADVTVTELRDPAGTHRSVNLVAEDGSRRNWFDPRGVSEVVVDPEACRAAIGCARVAHIHLDDWCRQVLPLARERSLVISCDLQDVEDIDDPYRADFVAAADILFMSGANLSDPEAAALELVARRPRQVVVVGLGADGCLVAHDGAVEPFEPIELPARPVVDTNGAGDNLAIGFLVARYFGFRPLDQAVRRAQLGARWICSQRGDEKAPLSRARLEELLGDR